MIPEVPFFLEGEDGLYEFVYRRLRENGHMVVVVAEGSGQELIAESLGSLDKMSDASGNRLLLDVGLWLCQRLKVKRACHSPPISLTNPLFNSILCGRCIFLLYVQPQAC